jgi:hypothetical protein
VDNWHQAFRLANCLLAKYRDCDWFNSLETGIGKNNGVDNGEALLLEEGDLISASDDSGDLVNVITRIESFSIGSPESGWLVKIAKARKYFTAAHSDDVRQHNVPLPTVNRYFQTVTTQLLIMDLPVWRELDYPTQNFFNIAFARSADAGDWRDAELWADYTGSYKALTDYTSLQATIGDCLTALDDTTNVYTFDNVSTVRVQLTTQGATLSDCTETEALNGKNLCALGGDDGWEILNFTVATLVGGTDDTYDLSGFLRGRFGTEHQTGIHTTDDKFCLLDENVQTVPIDLAFLNKEYNYKAQTRNEDLTGSTTQVFTWSGQSRKPLSVVNVRGSRDSENDLLIEFEGRTRTGGGIRDDQGGAVNEEEEVYKVQILDGSGNPVDRSPLIVTVGMPQAAALNTYASGNPDKFDHIDQHSVSVTGTGVAVHGRALQTIWQTGNYIEATLMATGPAAATLALLDNTLTTRYSISVVPATLSIGVNDGVSNIIVGDYDTGDEVRLRISLSGTEVRFYLNYDGGSTPPLFTSPVPPSYPLIPGCTAASGSGGTASVFKMFLTTRPYPKTIYGHGQQSQDGYSPGDPIEMDIWQWSPVSGDGTKVRTVL